MSEIRLQAILAPAPDLIRAEPFVIGGDPKGRNILYTSAKNVIIRNVENPLECDVYSEHLKNATAAEYAPSGNYICSGDVTGTLRIWDAEGEEHRLKNQFPVMAGAIKNICWGPESKRIAACGDGRETRAVVIMSDSGNSLGKLDQLLAVANSISYKQTRPFRVAVGETRRVIGYEGPPFKFKKRITDSTQRVNCVKFSPDGRFLASCSSDGEVYIYDGKSWEKIAQLGEPKAHEGGVYSLAWSSNSKELMSASADKTIKIWDVEKKEEVVKFSMGKELEDQQLSCLWQGDFILSVSLSGDINYLDRNDPSKPSRILHGHSKPISTIRCMTHDSNVHISADISGKMIKFNSASGEARPFSGKGHNNKVVAIFHDPSTDEIISVGWDDKVFFTSYSTLDFSAAASMSLESQPMSAALVDGLLIISTENALLLIRDKKVVFTLENEHFKPMAMDAHGNKVAIEAEKNKVALYDIEGDTLVDSNVSFSLLNRCDKLAFSPNGSKLAVAIDKVVRVYEVTDGFDNFKEFYGPTGRIMSLKWSPDGDKLITSSVDHSICLWNVTGRGVIREIDAHVRSVVADIGWLDNDNVLSVADDSLTKKWAIVW